MARALHPRSSTAIVPERFFATSLAAGWPDFELTQCAVQRLPFAVARPLSVDLPKPAWEAPLRESLAQRG